MALERGICPRCGRPVIESPELVPTSKDAGVYDDWDRLWHLGCIEALKKSEINKKRYGIRRFDAG